MFSIQIIAQDTAYEPIIQSDSIYGKEVIPFPIDWAPKLTLNGYEELTFFPNWKKDKDDEFWTLIMAWRVKSEAVIPIYELQFNLNHYFYSLMIPNHWSNNFPDPILHFYNFKTNKNLENNGKMMLFDGFHTGKMITLNIQMSQTICSYDKHSIIVFRMSPKAFDHDIWKRLKAFNLNTDVCKSTDE